MHTLVVVNHDWPGHVTLPVGERSLRYHLHTAASAGNRVQYCTAFPLPPSRTNQNSTETKHITVIELSGYVYRFLTDRAD